MKVNEKKTIYKVYELPEILNIIRNKWNFVRCLYTNREK